MKFKKLLAKSSLERNSDWNGTTSNGKPTERRRQLEEKTYKRWNWKFYVWDFSWETTTSYMHTAKTKTW